MNQTLRIFPQRCWHDAEDVPPQTPFSDPLMRPLQRGEVGVSFYADPNEREILPESDLRLVDRSLQPGDFCKRNISDQRSGVVLEAQVKGKIEHVISAEPLEGWRTRSDLLERREAEIGDYVISVRLFPPATMGLIAHISYIG